MQAIFLKIRTLAVLIVGLALLSGCSIRSFKRQTSKKKASYRAAYSNYGSRYTSPARFRATMRSYRRLGHTYHPSYVKIGDKMVGKASWYGAYFHGKRTSNGERYNMHALTAAHKTWPMDTMVRVENLANGRSCIVRINDRGPFVKNRIIDCSYAVGKRLGFYKKGVTPVRLTVVGFAGKLYTPSPSSEEEAVPLAMPLSDFGVQVGLFSSYEEAKNCKEDYAMMLRFPLEAQIKEVPFEGETLYQVRIMGFEVQEEAENYLRENGISQGFIIRD